MCRVTDTLGLDFCSSSKTNVDPSLFCLHAMDSSGAPLVCPCWLLGSHHCSLVFVVHILVYRSTDGAQTHEKVCRPSGLQRCTACGMDGHGFMPPTSTNACGHICKYVDRKSLAAILTPIQSTGVTPEVKFEDHSSNAYMLILHDVCRFLKVVSQ